MGESSTASSRRFRKGFALIKGVAEDGTELYITRGDGFEIRGGEPETHASMLSMAKKIMRIIKMRGYNVGRLSKKEYFEVNKIVRDVQDGKI